MPFMLFIIIPLVLLAVIPVMAAAISTSMTAASEVPAETSIRVLAWDCTGTVVAPRAAAAASPAEPDSTATFRPSREVRPSKSAALALSYTRT